ncbi:hypothetical protein R1flu_017125 [Riccia fluitans]|uniref:Uncharacterized protein n=1 Tax=Riccia fluitans TaxID=41844 RepID=A0ABD1YRU0_9MARC
MEFSLSDDVIDHVTIEYLRETQYSSTRLPNVSFSHPFGASTSDDWRPTPSVYGGQSSGEVHGRPVPGDRDYVRLDHTPRGATDPSSFVCEEFAPSRLVEMMKMLRIMRSTHERNFGSRKVHSRLEQDVAISGLEKEHTQYVKKLESEWRAVAKILCCKSKEKAGESVECSASDVSSHLELESCCSSKVVESNESASSPNFAPAEFGSFDQGANSAHVYHGETKDILEDEHVVRVRKSRGRVPVQIEASDQGEQVVPVDESKGRVPVWIDDDDGRQDDISESSRMAPEVIDDNNRGVRGKADTTISDVDTRRGTASGGTYKELWSESHHEAESCNECDGVDICEKSIYNETIPQELPKPEHDLDSPVVYPTSLAWSDSEFEKNPNGLDVEDIPFGKTPVVEVQQLQSMQLPKLSTDLENPSEKYSQRRSKSQRYSNPFSPFKDRSNIPSGSEQKRIQHRVLVENRPMKPLSWVSGLRTPERSPKRLTSFDFRRRTDSKGNQVSPNVSEDLSDFPVIPKPRLVRSATMDVRHTMQRGKAINEDPKAVSEASKDENEVSTLVDIPPLPTTLSSIRVDRTDKDCNISEPTHRSCASCQRRRALNSNESNSLGKLNNRSPSSSQQVKSGRNIFDIRHVPSKHSDMEKSSGMKKSNAVLKKASLRLSSPDSEGSEAIHQTSSPQSREESPRSTAVQGTPDKTKNAFKDTPTLRRSSTWNDRSQTLDAKLTPGGPRRGGKVDRVARSLEGPRSSNEQPPFVVPSHGSIQRIRSSRTVL